MHGFAIHMFDAIISLENLFTAWNEFRLGKRSTADVQDFERNLEDILTKLIQDKVSDPNVLRLLHDITNSFMVVDNLIERERASRNSDWKSHLATFCERVHESF